MSWKLKNFEALNSIELYQILRQRNAVFILEQNCVYQDVDEKDFQSIHLFFQRNDEVLAYCRLMPRGVNYEECSIGRVMTAKSIRHEGLGIELMNRAIKAARELWPNETIKISAQLYLERFYKSFGFETVSSMYLEDGIPHVAMLLKP